MLSVRIDDERELILDILDALDAPRENAQIQAHGIIAALSSALAESGANIVSSDQYSTDPEGGAFFPAWRSISRGWRNDATNWRSGSASSDRSSQCVGG
jgi:hypothetical protein